MSFDIAEIIEEAFERAAVDVQTLNSHHLRTARRSMNMMFSSWAARNVRVWAISMETETLTAGDPDFTVPTDTIDVLDAVLRREGVDTPMIRLGRSDYVAIPNKTTQGRPDRFFVDKSQDPIAVTLWQTPINSTDQVVYWRIRRQAEAAAYTGSPDVPYHWVDALTAELASRIYNKKDDASFNQQRADGLTRDAAIAFGAAISEDRDRASTMITPGGYEAFAR